MTIEEQIEIFDHNAEHERQEQDLQGCLNFKQLAEWLKKLKAYEDGCKCEDCAKYNNCKKFIDMCREWEYGGRE